VGGGGNAIPRFVFGRLTGGEVGTGGESSINQSANKNKTRKENRELCSLICIRDFLAFWLCGRGGWR